MHLVTQRGVREAGCTPRPDSSIDILLPTYTTVCRAVKSEAGSLGKVCVRMRVCV